MFRVKVHRHIEQIVEIFSRVGFWHRGDEATVAEWMLKLFYSIFHFLLPLSIMVGAFASGNQDESVFLADSTIITAVMVVKLLHILWRKKETLELMNRICDYGVEDRDTFAQIRSKINVLMKFIAVFFSLVYFCSNCATLVTPFLGSERRLFYNIAFPLDYKNNEFAFWMAFAFIYIEVIISAISMLFSAIVWYLLANCCLRYVALRQQIKVMGEIDETAFDRKISNAQKDKLYLRDLLAAIKSHQHLEKLTNQLNSFLSELFAVQLITGGSCICASVYCLAFNRDNNLMENLIYLIIMLHNIFDIFMLMYFGNEIQMASDRLSYSLFESDWVDRSHSIKKNVLIFGEFLMKPQQMIVFKVYPLTLATFTTILNSAYSMFNILLKLN